VYSIDFEQLKIYWTDFWQSPKGKILSSILKYTLIAAVLGYLIYQLAGIGWAKVYTSLPVTPWFYVLFVILYFALPVSEQFIYRLSLNFSFWEGFKIFIKKKVLNADVMGYSGEALFYFWAKDTLKEDAGYILAVIKDNNIISSLTSTITAIVLLSIFLYVGEINIRQILDIGSFTVVLIVFIVLLIIGLLIYFRNYVISLDAETVLKIFGIHQARILLVYTLEIVQWMVVLPTVPLYVWFTFLSIRIIASRLPVSQDLLFVSISIEISQYVDVSNSSIAGIMLASTVLSKVMNLFLYLLLMVIERSKKYLRINGKI
jgi:hypothetical protein